MQNIFQASRGIQYPEVPAGWPSRAVRRAVRFNRNNRLPPGWAQVLLANPELRKRIEGMH